MNKKNILVTGSEGFIGSILVPLLINKNYNVIGLDSCFFSDGNFHRSKKQKYQLLKKDIRDTSLEDLEALNLYGVIHLAALSNDPLGMLNEELTYDINYKASVRLAELSKKAKINRFIYSSSCSLYGAGSKEKLTENEKPNPQTAYGKSKILAEEGICTLASKDFSPTYMRNATAYGVSPRMRFDLVVNSLTGFAKVENKIKILGDGKPWRPIVHIKDISKAMISVLEADREKIHNQPYNIGDNKENFQILDIANKIQKNYYNDCKVTIGVEDAGDTRDYNVDFTKLNQILGYKCEQKLDTEINTIGKIYEKENLTEKIFTNRLYNRLKQIEYLQSEKLIDGNLRNK